MSEDNKSKTPVIVVICATVLVLSLWSASWFVVNAFAVGDERGVFGDSYGAVNALFTGLALIGLAYAISLQRKEIKLSQKLIDEQKRALKMQNEELIKQSFENAFFKMLDLIGVTSQKIYVSWTGAVHNNAEVAFSQIYSAFSMVGAYEYPNFISAVKYEEIDLSAEHRIHVREDALKSIKSDVDMIYMTIYEVLSYINENGSFAKERYYTLVRAQVGAYVKVVLFYCCLIYYKDTNFKELIEEAQFLKGFDKKMLLDQLHADLYQKKAFGEY